MKFNTEIDWSFSDNTLTGYQRFEILNEYFVSGGGEIQLKLNKYKAPLNFLQRKFLVRIFKTHILKLGVRGGSPGGMKLNKYKAPLNFLQRKFLVRIF